ncbi:hypothetical protein VOLCADRAFT_90897 [Volvox carteri f. nagariensis]|uniref:VWFA domain-containing protein n=1 Tax=Volvox carteri f. nagariensis TaxID=3068 RepID=D8TVC7_VOLCA|nr:uncharacterized protein VOLCADRAFT_90897 [Volvox carteri f. nagariensis]EFJ48678.1 hypothetical protein VOLCADRAFT_90897 [Volvox carteri f. nagariensis]|eukprot:XP_002950477.1 hypothetical protein VOLCADRAFT_90897 [Volvox carteri f. nagariensis]
MGNIGISNLLHAQSAPLLARLGARRADGKTVHLQTSGGDSAEALQASSRGLAAWSAALSRGLLPDDSTLQQLVAEGDDFAAACAHSPLELLSWPEEPLRTMMIRALAKLGVGRLCKKYPAVRDALLKSVLETVVRYHRMLAGIEEEKEEREKDIHGNVFKTAAELQAEEEAQRAATRGGGHGHGGKAVAAPAVLSPAEVTAARLRAAAAAASASGASPEKATAFALVKELYGQWQAPVETLGRAGRAFEGLEALLGADGFDLEGSIWKRQGWAQLDELRRKLEDLKELRDLVRSLGRGGGWGPLRRAPVQYLDLNARPGLLRTVLEAQETRGLTRSEDISRLLPAEAALLARGRQVRQAKLLFYARLAEKALQTYERDGWGEYPTQVEPERREIRPTADRGPILLCVDTSGSMRGARETVAKALALECMRAARQQERGCYVFAFSGPQEVRELELNMDAASLDNLLGFLEKANGELRQPAPAIMRKLAGAKEGLGLRVHGLVVGSPEKKRADPAVLRALCTNYLPNGKVEVLVSTFEDWASVQAESAFQLDWDDVEGNSRRRLANLAHEKRRQEEARRKKSEAKRDISRTGVLPTVGSR